jgi:hypothetical protein
MGMGQRVSRMATEVAATRQGLEQLLGQAAGLASNGLWAQRLSQVRAVCHVPPR